MRGIEAVVSGAAVGFFRACARFVMADLVGLDIAVAESFPVGENNTDSTVATQNLAECGKSGYPQAKVGCATMRTAAMTLMEVNGLSYGLPKGSHFRQTSGGGRRKEPFAKESRHAASG